MILEIKNVARCRNGAYGNFHTLGRDRALITVSLRKNKLLHEYMATLLHEMLHCYTTLVRGAGFRTTNKKEHRWIEDCETAIIELLKKHYKRGK